VFSFPFIREHSSSNAINFFQGSIRPFGDSHFLLLPAKKIKLASTTQPCLIRAKPRPGDLTVSDMLTQLSNRRDAQTRAARNRVFL
jgi:hypothetical protein